VPAFASASINATGFALPLEMAEKTDAAAAAKNLSWSAGLSYRA